MGIYNPPSPARAVIGPLSTLMRSSLVALGVVAIISSFVAGGHRSSLGLFGFVGLSVLGCVLVGLGVARYEAVICGFVPLLISPAFGSASSPSEGLPLPVAELLFTPAYLLAAGGTAWWAWRSKDHP
jgi:hypothetical protein